MPSTYVGRNIALQAAGSILPGSAQYASSASAAAKSLALKDVQQHYFHSDAAYSGGDIAVNDALKAIQYARSKKLTKAKRKAVIGAAKTTASIVGMAAGATIGSVIPVAGTIAGGAIGGVGLGTVGGAAITGLDQAKRKIKGIFKAISGTRGEHRDQAARALLYCQGCLAEDDPKQGASDAALYIILGDEFDEVMAMALDACVERVADRLKSN